MFQQIQYRRIALIAATILPLLAMTSLVHAAGPSAPPTTTAWRMSPDLSQFRNFGEHAQTYRIMLIIFQIAAILVAAKVLGWLAERIKVPGVIGELVAGALIGPYLLGSLIQLPLHGHWIPLFPAPTAAGEWPVNDVIWSIAQFASIVLLFITGLHTDLKQFLRYVGPAAFIALLGLIVPFALGTATVYIPFFSNIARHDAGQSVLVPALFIGAILAATSIGITARVLGDIGKLDTSEGVAIIGAAVIDDVLGIIALAIVGGIADTGTVSFSGVGIIAAKAFGFWIVLTGGILLLARPIERLIKSVRYSGGMIGLGLGLAFACSAAAEGFGLAFIIGAYSVGLGLSRTKLAHELMDELRPINDFIVPVFFATLGMLVNFNAMLSDWRVIVFGLVVTAVAIIGKLFGCGIAARATGFNLRGAYRIGVGMMPRGEVALIVAGIGLSRNIIQANVFGVSIMMTLLTTILAPILLVPAFKRGGSGRSAAEQPQRRVPAAAIGKGARINLPRDMGEVLLNRLLKAAADSGWVGTFDEAASEIYVLRNGPDAAEIRLADGVLHIGASGTRQAELIALFENVRRSLIRDATTCPVNAEQS